MKRITLFNQPIGLIWILAVLLISSSCKQTDYKSKYEQLKDDYVNMWNTGDVSKIEDILHPDFELRMVPDFAPMKGLDAFKNLMGRMRKIDFHVEITEIVYASESATARWIISANYPDSTGALTKHTETQGISLIHFKDGKVLDEWIAYDNKDWLEKMK
jgi:ketosteroid isomerase-like protein